MNKSTLLLLAVILTGCSTPGDFVNEGPTAEYKSTRTPIQAANCVARNGDEFFQGYSGTVRNAVDGEPIDVVVRAGQNLLSLVQVYPLPVGSNIKLFSRHWLASAIKLDGLTVDERLTKGCL